jgi:hypothetical protein
MSQKGAITENDLMHKLVQAKKVMNKVDSGSFETGNINRDAFLTSTEDILESQQPQQPQNVKSNPTVNMDKIQNSKLPDAIKKAMMENPIPQISLNDTLDMDFVKGAKRLMEQEGVSSKSKPSQQQKTTSVSNIDMNSISVLIENTIRKVLDEKLNQILTAQQTSTINENLVLKVGDSIFKGKITGVNKAK